jgi:integrase
MAVYSKVKDTKGHYVPNLYIDPRSGHYYVRKYKEGKESLNKSLGKISFTLAKRIKDEMIAEWLGEDNPALRNKKKLHKFSQTWEEKYFPHKIKTTKKSTQTAYDVAYRTHLKPFFGDMFVEQINDELWQEFLDNTPKGKILFNSKKGLSNFLNYCHKTLKIKHQQPTLRLPAERKQKKKGSKNAVGHVYSRRQVVLAARVAGKGSELRLAVLMGYRMGMRPGEVCSLRYSEGNAIGQYNYCEFKRDGVVIHLHETKTKKYRGFYADLMVERILSKRRKERRSEWVFPQRRRVNKRISTNGLDRYWQAVKRRVGIKHRFHDLRHTFLTWKFKEHGAKTNMALICNYAGLTLSEAERTYLHLDENDTKGVVRRGDI